MASRDAQTDAGRMGAPSQTKANMAAAAKDFTAITLGEMERQGMQPGSMPEGGTPTEDTEFNSY